MFFREITQKFSTNTTPKPTTNQNMWRTPPTSTETAHQFLYHGKVVKPNAERSGSGNLFCFRSAWIILIIVVTELLCPYACLIRSQASPWVVQVPLLSSKWIRYHRFFLLEYLNLQRPLSALVKYLAALFPPIPWVYSSHNASRVRTVGAKTAFLSQPLSICSRCEDIGSLFWLRAVAAALFSILSGLLSILQIQRWTALLVLPNSTRISSW